MVVSHSHTDEILSALAEIVGCTVQTFWHLPQRIQVVRAFYYPTLPSVAPSCSQGES
eukprot:COSAG02_NODE_29731_length_564_cov_0.784946_1_plen_56_part_10